MLILALAWFSFAPVSIAASTVAPSKNAGQLIIWRAANLGTRLTLNISIDGAQVASLVRGQSYKGSLSPGEHVISLTVAPRSSRFGTTTKHLTVHPGQSYGFTAMFSGRQVVLK